MLYFVLCNGIYSFVVCMYMCVCACGFACGRGVTFRVCSRHAVISVRICAIAVRLGYCVCVCVCMCVCVCVYGACLCVCACVRKRELARRSHLCKLSVTCTPDPGAGVGLRL